jgi:glucokinase
MVNDFVMGIDIGGTNTVYGFINREGEIIHYDQIPTNGDKPIYNLLERLEKPLKDFLDANSTKKLKGIGIGAPNGNYYTGNIENPPNLNWGSIDIKSILEKKFQSKVLLTNDANAAAIGEKSYGAAKKMSDFVMITLGTGLGSGIYANNKLIYGCDGFAGEMGHIIVENDGRRCNCGNKGCLESYVSANGINKTIDQMMIKYPESNLLRKLRNRKEAGKILDMAYDENHKIAIKIYSYTGKMLGRGLSNVATLLSPEAFIFYGGYSNAGSRIFDYAEQEMNKNLLEGQKGKIKIIRSKLLDGQAGVLGAAALIWSHEK